MLLFSLTLESVIITTKVVVVVVIHVVIVVVEVILLINAISLSNILPNFNQVR